ncbi:branched-chain amino acid ABC transporter permease [Crocosphaera sp. Alani8]|uniref:branched-chain amino acid ABC transporter permease n=1 Tax=Crocosphaera sp. Alani8 TaxID=3038952 RepID=UPI00313E891D
MNNPLLEQFIGISGLIIYVTTSAGIYSIFALGLNLQWGFTGLINFGVVGFMTLGAYTSVLLTVVGVPFILAVLMGAILAAILGLLIGLSTLRLREDYLAIVTIGVSELVRLVASNEEWLTRGVRGLQGYPLPLNIEAGLPMKILLTVVFSLLALYAQWTLYKSLAYQWKQNKEIQGKSYQPRKPFSLIVWGIITTSLILIVYLAWIIALWFDSYEYNQGLMVLVLLVLAIVYASLELLVNSPWGRVLKSIREDEEVPRALGKNILLYKLQAFMLGGAIAGTAGAFFAWQLRAIYPDRFEPLITFNTWIIVVLGGSGSNAGTLLGAVIFWSYDSLTRFILPQLGISSQSQAGYFRIMIIGLILMILMVWRPQGILGKKEELTLGR